jgi:hypothetical protein
MYAVMTCVKLKDVIAPVAAVVGMAGAAAVSAAGDAGWVAQPVAHWLIGFAVGVLLVSLALSMKMFFSSQRRRSASPHHAPSL